ncbi:MULTISPECIES: serine/threonine-protein kinase [unclassified Okeania]|uniref:serine/threonine-protein kinase n=1 Tax=unclassified Okeania TaxID=2634635 RepID=UPI00257EEEDF|nr:MULTISPECIES: serine/threonine-protein kinase [unclassified Okeania]
MSYCLNPNCPNPSDPLNAGKRTCCQCGSQLLLQNRYRVIKPLGGGGFGKTYLVDDQGVKKVLKVLLKSHPKAVSLFQQEAQVLISLRNPGIPKIEKDGYFTFFPENSDESIHCLVMEFIGGANLQDWMKSRRHRPINQAQAVDWLTQLSEILEKVHQQNYFHRDIKPHNIMRRLNGQLVLIDFGTVREVSETYLVKVGQGENVTGIVSPGYTAPEQTNGKAVPQSDFFALGRTFVYLLTGKPPTAFPENPRSGKLQWRKYAPHISKRLADIVDYLMAPFPGNRPQTPAMILQCLAEIDTGDSSGKENYRMPSPSKQTKRGQENTKLPTDQTQTRSLSRTKFKTKISRNQSRNQSNIKLKNNLIIGLTMLLLAVATSQFYGFWRYRIFPADPILLLRGLNSSRFLQNTLNGYLGPVNAIALTPDGQILATSSSNTIKIWNLKTEELKNNIADAHTAQVTTLAISPSGQILVSGSADQTIKFWDLGVGKLIDTILAHQGQVNVVAISPDGQTLASVGSDRLMKLWNIQTSSRMLTWIPDQEHEVNTLAFSRDGTILVSGSNDGTIRLWNVSTGIRRQTLEGHTKAVSTVVISPDNQTLASGSEDGTIILWNLNTGEKESVIKPNIAAVKSIVFTPDHQKIVAAGENITIWDLITEEKLQTLIGHSESISSLAITPDGKTLVSGSADQTIKVWRIP